MAGTILRTANVHRFTTVNANRPYGFFKFPITTYWDLAGALITDEPQKHKISRQSKQPFLVMDGSFGYFVAIGSQYAVLLADSASAATNKSSALSPDGGRPST
jgi:hypothetical protein